MSDALNQAYRERNELAAAFASVVGNAWVGVDPLEPDWPVLYVDTPAGQVSWHFSPDDKHLIAHVPRRDTPWDGHTPEERTARLRRLT